MTVDRYRELLEPLVSERALAIRSVKAERGNLEAAEVKVRDAVAAQGLIQEAAEAAQSEAHKQLAGVVTRCLRTVFGEEGSGFRIAFERKRGRTEARLSFVKDGHELAPGDDGGGALDIAGLALRVASLVMSQPSRRRFLALDEPFRFVSRDHHFKVRKLVEALAQEMKIQFLIITHSPRLKMGKVIEIGETKD